jgi:hypothetical protein
MRHEPGVDRRMSRQRVRDDHRVRVPRGRVGRIVGLAGVVQGADIGDTDPPGITGGDLGKHRAADLGQADTDLR